MKKTISVLLAVLLLAACFAPCVAAAERTFPSDSCDHQWVWVVDVVPGALSDGRQHQVCTVCGAVQNMNTRIPSRFSNPSYDNAFLLAFDVLVEMWSNLFGQISAFFR